MIKRLSLKPVISKCFLLETCKMILQILMRVASIALQFSQIKGKIHAYFLFHCELDQETIVKKIHLIYTEYLTSFTTDVPQYHHQIIDYFSIFH